MKSLAKHKNKNVKGDLNGFMSDYLAIKRQAVILPYLNGKKNVLDVGCGIFRWQGLLSSEMEYVGIDCEKSIIEYNREHYTQKFFLVNLNLDDIPDAGKNFDLIILSAVIEHINNPEVILKKLGKHLRTDGLIVLTTPHPMGNQILNYGAKIGIFSNDKQQHHDLLNRQRIYEIAESSSYRLTTYTRFLFGFNQLAVLKKKKEF